MSKIRFNVTAEALRPGINLIEANAGTGKTYTIAMLFVRFIVEHGFLIDQLLVVTFTHAAAAELKTANTITTDRNISQYCFR